MKEKFIKGVIFFVFLVLSCIENLNAKHDVNGVEFQALINTLKETFDERVAYEKAQKYAQSKGVDEKKLALDLSKHAHTDKGGNDAVTRAFINMRQGNTAEYQVKQNENPSRGGFKTEQRNCNNKSQKNNQNYYNPKNSGSRTYNNKSHQRSGDNNKSSQYTKSFSIYVDPLLAILLMFYAFANYFKDEKVKESEKFKNSIEYHKEISNPKEKVEVSGHIIETAPKEMRAYYESLLNEKGFFDRIIQHTTTNKQGQIVTQYEIITNTK